MGQGALQGFIHLCQRQDALVNCFPSLTQPYVEAEQRRVVAAARLETRNAFFLHPTCQPTVAVVLTDTANLTWVVNQGDGLRKRQPPFGTRRRRDATHLMDTRGP